MRQNIIQMKSKIQIFHIAIFTTILTGCAVKKYEVNKTSLSASKVDQPFYIEKQVISKKKPLSKSISGIIYSDYENGNREFEATFTEGIMNGIYKLWHDNGQLQLNMQYKEGVKEGVFIKWYENGQIGHKANYNDNLLDGIRERWATNGQLIEIQNFCNGIMVGEHKQWYVIGQINSSYSYNEKGEKNGLQQSWHQNGQLRTEGMQRNGKKDGFFNSWHENGQKLAERNFKDDKRIGNHLVWHNNGQLKNEANYNEDGSIKGNPKQWDKSGKPIKEKSRNTIVDEASIGHIFDIVEQGPEFPGGTSKLLEYLSSNLKIPKSESVDMSKSKVFVQFIVMANGQIINAKIIRGVGSDIDKEALRVVNDMPRWVPGKQRGKPVNTRYNLPIRVNWK